MGEKLKKRIVVINDKILRIGVFYDGNFFHHVSSYFNFEHSVKKWISLKGLHGLIKGVTAYHLTDCDLQKCRITRAHYFRGRYNAHDASDRNFLFRERAFEDLLIKENINLHYRLLSSRNTEKGVDASLILKVHRLALESKIDVAVLITSDGDFAPLVNELEAVGVRTMIVGCNFEFYKYNYIKQQTKTCYHLIEDSSFHVLLNEFVDKKFPTTDTDKQKYFQNLLNNLFVVKQEVEKSFESKIWGEIITLKDTYGFIKSSQFAENMFFHHSQLINGSFDQLEVGDEVEFLIGDGYEGPCAIEIERVANKIKC